MHLQFHNHMQIHVEILLSVALQKIDVLLFLSTTLAALEIPLSYYGSVVTYWPQDGLLPQCIEMKSSVNIWLFQLNLTSFTQYTHLIKPSHGFVMQIFIIYSCIYTLTIGMLLTGTDPSQWSVLIPHGNVPIAEVSCSLGILQRYNVYTCVSVIREVSSFEKSCLGLYKGLDCFLLWHMRTSVYCSLTLFT